MRLFPLFSAILCASGLSLLAQPPQTARAAAPLAVDCRNSAFTSPAPGAVVAGALEIRGRANVPDFRFYKVEFSPLQRENWVLIGPDVIRTAVLAESRLVIWQTTIVPDGPYRLRMHVVDVTGNYCELSLQPVIVANGQPPVSPSPSPLPTETETPVLTAVPPQPTLTVRPSLITDVVPARTPALGSNGRGLPLPDSNLVAFGGIFALGACGMGSVIVFVFVATRLVNRHAANLEDHHS